MQPFSRRTNRLDCRRSEKKSAFAPSNDAFLLDEMTSSVTCRKSHVTDDVGNDVGPTVARASDLDHCDTDDDAQLVDGCWSAPHDAVTTADNRSVM